MSSLTRPTRRLPPLSKINHIFLVAGEVLNDDLVTEHFFLAVVESFSHGEKPWLPVPVPIQ